MCFYGTQCRRHSIQSSIPRRRLVAPPSECRWVAILVCKINLLTLWHWPLTFELQNCTISRVSQGHSLYQVWTLLVHSFLSYAPNKQTNRQTDGLEHSINANRHSRCGYPMASRLSHDSQLMERALNSCLVPIVLSRINSSLAARSTQCYLDFFYHTLIKTSFIHSYIHSMTWTTPLATPSAVLRGLLLIIYRPGRMKGWVDLVG